MSFKDATCPISKEIYLRECFNDFKQDLPVECLYRSTEINALCNDFELLGTDKALIKQTIENCNLQNLSCETDKYTWDEIKYITPREKNNLKQFKSFEYFEKGLNEHNKNMTQFLFKTNRKNPFSRDLSYKNSRNIESVQCDDSANLIIDDILVTVVIFKPLKKCDQSNPQANCIKSLKPEMRIDLLGNQTLEDLVKAIQCKNDESLLGDFSNNLDGWENHKVTSRDYFKGGFFLIGTTFYDFEDGEDISTNIIDWISSSAERIEQFGILDKKSMKDMKLIDLRMCVGQPYLYQHLGDCEHFFAFSDIKLVNKHDCQDPCLYPIITGRVKYKAVKCVLCETAIAEWIVTDCLITPLDKTPFCDFCIRLYLYTPDKKKAKGVGDFKVFRLSFFS